jgi:hypothetical protein
MFGELVELNQATNLLNQQESTQNSNQSITQTLTKV